MKAAIYKGPNGISIVDKEVPAIGSKDVLVKNLRAGICGTDINIVKEGSFNGISMGAEFGHEMAGEVVQVGREVSPDIKPGMIVGINPITAKKAGRWKSLECGGFSQFIAVEDAMLNYNLYAFNAGVPVETAALMEPMSVGRHGAFHTHPHTDHKVVVLGAGPIGLGAAASLIAEGIENVCVVDVNDMRLQAAVVIGAKSLNTTKVDLKTGLTGIFGEIDAYGQKMPDADIFIDAAGSPFLFDEVIKIVKPGARISIIAVYKSEVPVSLGQVMSKEVNIIGSSGYTDEDIRAVVGYINENKTKITSTISKVYKLDNIEEAFKAAIEGKDVIKVLIDLE